MSKALPTCGTPILRSKGKEISAGGAPSRIVLTKMPEEDTANWVTHQTNEQSGGAFLGHYKAKLENAIKDYIERCGELGIDPEPELLEEDFEHVAEQVRRAVKFPETYS